MHLWLYLFGVVALVAKSEAFLFDPPIPEATTRSTVQSTTPDINKLLRCSEAMLKCMEPFKALFNYSDPQSISQVDTDAVVNFTCSAEGEKLVLCVANIDDCDANTKGVLPSLEHNRDVCKHNRTALHDSTKCQTKFIVSEAWQSCYEDAVSSNQTSSDGKQCVAMRGVYDCYYKYVNLVCPEHWSFFEGQIRTSYNGPCHMVIGQSPTATSCDDKMHLTCHAGRPEISDSDGVVADLLCSEEGKQAHECLERYEALCSPTNVVKDDILELLYTYTEANRDFLCQDNKHDMHPYNEFMGCAAGLANDTNFQTCMAMSLPDPTLDYKSCSFQRQQSQCIKYALGYPGHCMPSLRFYDRLLLHMDNTHLLNCTLGHGPDVATDNITTTDACDNVTAACFGGIDPNNTRAFVEHMCRSGGKTYIECISRQCGPNGSAQFHGSNIGLLTIACQDIDGYANFVSCIRTIGQRNPSYDTCVDTSDNATMTHAEQCRRVQRSYDCQRTAITASCPTVLPYFTTTGFQLLKLPNFGKHCHLVPSSATMSIVG